MLDIKITKTTAPKAKPQDESKLGFGKIFSDHMFLMDYTEGEGWHDARIVPYGPWDMDPATTVFHYAQEIFEGMKAYRTAEGKIQLFRPDCNANRFNDSADRLGMPPIPPEDFVQAVKAIVDVDRDWVPIRTAPRCISAPSASPPMWAWACMPPSIIVLPSSARLPAPTTPRVWIPCASTWKTNTSVPPRA